MTPQDHNKTLVIIYSFLGVVSALALSYFLVGSLKASLSAPLQHKESFPIGAVGITLFGASLFLSIAWGLFKRRAWARTFALVLSGLLVWLVPLGTALAAYTWWFMHSEGGKLLYSRSST